MTVNKQQKAKITIEQLYAQPLNYKVGVIFFFYYTKNGGMQGESEKNMRSGEPVQNIINVNIWVSIYIEISYSHIFI